MSQWHRTALFLSDLYGIAVLELHCGLLVGWRCCMSGALFDCFAAKRCICFGNCHTCWILLPWGFASSGQEICFKRRATYL
ncbi:uncharacterized protein IWZ02DRAFT_26414 [Phyllosticta citriasiana]|uniref:uncharacterized protein n=1 Tax=Phyllosticta citriasiana TaxID=595635 RepID=UPI0030FD4165